MIYVLSKLKSLSKRCLVGMSSRSEINDSDDDRKTGGVARLTATKKVYRRATNMDYAWGRG